jgi:membrane associated rhomboid family serine protease
MYFTTLVSMRRAAFGGKTLCCATCSGAFGKCIFFYADASLLLQTIGIGFSGVVSAVVFCMIVFYPKMRLLVFFVPMPAWVFAILYTLYSLYAGQSGGDGIDHWAHLGGAGAGAAYALLVRP